MGPGTPIGHDDDAVCHRPVVLRKSAHYEDGHIGPMNALTLSQGRRGGVRDEGNESHCTFVCKHPGALDMLTSSWNPRDLSNNEVMDSAHSTILLTSGGSLTCFQTPNVLNNAS